MEVLERKPEELDFIEELDIVKEEGMARGRRDKELRFDEAGELPVGARMRVARKNKGISLTAMTEKTAGEERPGSSVSYLSTVENGGAPPSFKLAEMYERILGLEKGELTQMLEKERKTPK